MSNVGATPTGNIFLDTIDPIIDPTQVSPTTQINGSSSGVAVPDGVGNPDAPTNAEMADALFPFFDGLTERLATNPVSQDGLTEYLFPGATPTMTPAFDANGNPLTQEPVFNGTQNLTGAPGEIPVADFFGFHSSHQLEYVLQFGQTVTGSSGAKMVTFIQGDDRVDVVVVPGQSQVFVLQQLSTADLAIMSPEVELALANALSMLPAALQTQIESVLGAVSGQEALDTLAGLIADAKGQVNGFFNTPGAGDFSADQIDTFKTVFTDQIDNINTRASSSQFLDLAEIKTRIGEIVRRANRANEFFIIVQTPPSSTGLPGQFEDVNAPVGDDISQSGISDGFNTFIAQETRLRDLDNQRIQMAQTGAVAGGRSMDGPTLIAIFQLNYNLTREAEITAETEELNQQNALLQTYAAVQQLLNDALREFGTGEEGAEETRNILGNDRDQFIKDVSPEQQYLIAFIEDHLSRGPGHPIEELRDINRPSLNFVFTDDGKLKRVSQNELNIGASQLADTVTQINQESQILTNEVSSISRESNRHFDLANNALRRLNDTLLSIARI